MLDEMCASWGIVGNEIQALLHSHGHWSMNLINKHTFADSYFESFSLVLCFTLKVLQWRLSALLWLAVGVLLLLLLFNFCLLFFFFFSLRRLLGAADWSCPPVVVTCSAVSVWETLWHHHTLVPPAGRDLLTASTTPCTSDITLRPQLSPAAIGPQAMMLMLFAAELYFFFFLFCVCASVWTLVLSHSW